MRRTLATILVLTATTNAQDWQELPLSDGEKLSYKLGLPDGYDADSTYPVLLALPPGPQTREMVEASWPRYWAEQASSRGWIVVSPSAPDGQLFFRGAERYLPELLRHLRVTYRIEHGRLHLAGVSNGGRSAFRLATQHPHDFLSVTVLPGYPPTAEDEARLDVLADVPVSMYAGGEDTRWVERMHETAAKLRDLGMGVTTTVIPGEGHTPPSLDGDTIMERLDELRAARREEDPIERAIAAVLDDFHDAAAKADEARYFAHFSPEGVFLGTDASERWTVAEFRAYSERAFARDSAWIYVPQEREIVVVGEFAFFDELLVNRSYGECRGTGCLRLIDGTWQIAQYSLSVPVPNAILRDVAEQIRALGRR
jgi:pimeloyl-ACP methyl ester carboxylesterase